MFEIGTAAPLAEVVVVELYHSIVHLGSSVLKKLTKWCWTAACPSVPGTRGIKMGDKRLPWRGSKFRSSEDMLRKKPSESGLYAFVMQAKRQCRMRIHGIDNMEEKDQLKQSPDELYIERNINDVISSFDVIKGT